MSNLLLNIGDKVPNFSIESTGNKIVTQDDFMDKYTLVYFYPKDSTPGCTTEGLDFTSLHDEFDKLNAQIYGVSMDSMRRHDNFKAKQNFSFDLLSDPEGDFCNLFGTYQLKKNFGKEYMGIVRTTYLISPECKVLNVWPNVKVKEHAQSVLEHLKSITKK